MPYSWRFSVGENVGRAPHQGTYREHLVGVQAGFQREDRRQGQYFSFRQVLPNRLGELVDLDRHPVLRCFQLVQVAVDLPCGTIDERENHDQPRQAPAQDVGIVEKPGRPVPLRR